MRAFWPGRCHTRAVVDRDADRLAHMPLARQVQALESIVRSNPVVAGVLDQLPALNLGSWYRAKAERWCRTWPQVTVLPWPSP